MEFDKEMDNFSDRVLDISSSVNDLATRSDSPSENEEKSAIETMGNEEIGSAQTEVKEEIALTSETCQEANEADATAAIHVCVENAEEYEELDDTRHGLHADDDKLTPLRTDIISTVQSNSFDGDSSTETPTPQDRGHIGGVRRRRYQAQGLGQEHANNSREFEAGNSAHAMSLEQQAQADTTEAFRAMKTMGTYRKLDFERLHRLPGETRAMPLMERLRKDFWRKFCRCCRRGDSVYSPSEPSEQYRIPPVDEGAVMVGFRNIFSMRMLDFTVWTLRTSWIQSTFVMLVFYFVMVNLFALLFVGLAEMYSKRHGLECLSSYDYGVSTGTSVENYNVGDNFEIAFALSWTTFSTVGYGAVSPSGTITGCWVTRYVCAFEAMVGLLYFGYCGAIVFAKIGRFLSKAQVTFSSTLCIQYGQGVEGATFDGGPVIKSMRLTASGAGDGSSAPYPVLEFRIVNDRANTEGWEILDGSLTCMVAIHKEVPDIGHEGITPDGSNTVIVSNSGKSIEVPLLQRKFYKLDVQSDTHPYFKRVWYVRHTLDAQSPLLTAKVRDEIRSRGCWPPEKNLPSFVRLSLVKFKHMIVTLNGTSNLSDKFVFAEKKYRFEDIHIGWQFAKLLYYRPNKKTNEKIIKVDLGLIHDIMPQNGGGNEPISRK